MAGLSRQLGRPEGLRGRAVAGVLNRANRSAVLAAVDGARLERGQVGADLGFGGGVGLAALLRRVGSHGVVHGVEVSDTALGVARRRWASDLEAGRLALHRGDLLDLPLDTGSVHAAITVNTIYFVADLEQVYAELFRIVRPEGRAVVGVGDPDAMRDRPFTATGFTLRAVPTLVRALQEAGFEGVTDERVGPGDRAFHVLVARRPPSYSQPVAPESRAIPTPEHSPRGAAAARWRNR